MVSNIPHEFLDVEDKDFNTNSVICNVYSVTKMCEIVLKKMKPQKRGIILNISSSLALVPSPYISTYSATKTYISTLSTCLATEYSEFGITIQDVTPNQVNTKLTKDISIGFISVTPKSFVEYSLKTVGKELHSNAHPKHKLLNNIGRFMTWWLPEWIIMSLTLNAVKNLRTKALLNNNDST